jgi:hypothetical protein
VAEIERGEAPDCFAVHVYSHREEYGLSENEAMFAGAPNISTSTYISSQYN